MKLAFAFPVGISIEIPYIHLKRISVSNIIQSIMSTRQEEANITYQVTHSGVTHTQVTHNQVTQDSNPPTHQQIWSPKDNQSHQVQESGF